MPAVLQEYPLKIIFWENIDIIYNITRTWSILQNWLHSKAMLIK